MHSNKILDQLSVTSERSQTRGVAAEPNVEDGSMKRPAADGARIRRYSNLQSPFLRNIEGTRDESVQKVRETQPTLTPQLFARPIKD